MVCFFFFSLVNNTLRLPLQKHKPVPCYINLISILSKIQRSLSWILDAGMEFKYRKKKQYLNRTWFL